MSELFGELPPRSLDKENQDSLDIKLSENNKDSDHLVNSPENNTASATSSKVLSSPLEQSIALSINTNQ